MSSRLVVLGSCGAWPEPGRACSGFVLEHDGYRVVLDLGYGTLPPLLELVSSTVGDGVDAVVVTHAHPDHMLDLHAFFRARWFGRREAPPVPLYAPEQVVTRLESLEEDDVAAVRRVFDWHRLPAEPGVVGPFTLSSWSLPHHVPNAGVRLETPGLTVAYTGDTGPALALAELGRDANLFIVECTDRRQVASAPHSAMAMHLDATQAGRAAGAAGARRLLLTHFWPGIDRERSRSAAAAVYDGEVLVADEGLEVPLP